MEYAIPLDSLSIHVTSIPAPNYSNAHCGAVLCIWYDHSQSNKKKYKDQREIASYVNTDAILLFHPFLIKA
jgi:hypothetical protein